MNPSAIDDFLPVLESWFGTAMACLYEQPPLRGDGALLMGCPVWGKKYLDRFQNYCLPSIVSAKNLGALAGRCHMVLFTDVDSFTRLWGMTKGLEAGGITIQLLLIPKEVMAYVSGEKPPPRVIDNKYWILGVAGNVMLQMAGRGGMAFHMLQPDHIYSAEYFPNLFRLRDAGHEAITQPGISAEISTAWQEIERHRVTEGQHKGTLPISGRDLGTIGWKHLHKQTKACLMNEAIIPTKMPHSHLMVWQGERKIVVHCCHMNPAYLSPRLCAMAPTRIPATLDAELPAFIPDGKFYVPQIHDGMTYLEVSDKEKGALEEFVDFETFSERWWMHVRHLNDWMAYSIVPYEIPIRRQKKFIADDEIKRQFDDVLARLIADNPPGAARRFIPRLAYKH
jgi:hypothetical protein